MFEKTDKNKAHNENMAKLATRFCRNCRYWNGDDDHSLGECLRYPPPWPLTSQEQWCGEYAKGPRS